MNRREFLRLMGAGITASSVFLGFSTETLDEKLKKGFNEIREYSELPPNEFALILLGEYQKIYLVSGSDYGLNVHKEYVVSTGKNGFGNVAESGKTPTGVHQIKRKIGDNAPIGAVFEHGKITNEIADIYAERSDNLKGLVLTRILELGGMEEKNKTTNIRPIYVHGTNQEWLLGKAVSLGCVRMNNNDIINLYKLVKIGTYLNIIPP